MKAFYRITLYALFLTTTVIISSCESFLEVDLPKSQLASSAVFEDYNTAEAALLNIYSNIRDKGILTGTGQGISNTLGNYTDELVSSETPNNFSVNFYKNSLLPSNTTVNGFWNASYNQIYAANAIIEGTEKSQNLTLEQKKQLQGEALFIRSLLHFYLAQLFGDIPYITDTDYKKNSSVSKTSVAVLYEKISSDLKNASELLPLQYLDQNRVRPNSITAKALLSRIYLYAKLYESASNMASSVLNQQEIYTLETTDKVFLVTSRETIWQLQAGVAGRNTAEATYFTFTTVPPPQVSLTGSLVNSFEPGDLRRSGWIKTVSKNTAVFYHPFKYKENNATTVSKEYSIIFRTAEQYLIRAEARVYQGDLIGAKEDLNKVRNRAGLNDTSAVTQQEIITALIIERRHELFTEQGHRFFDLKRTGMLDSVLGDSKSGWNSTDNLMPIPQSELTLNKNLMPQNPGY
ncbi:RagB/SusD family nutrient uptake outer membrane protein [Flavobacterium limi]|uniref:Membrane protein n=1 Tax=Flavobacterium limi TaxID=2045105 RepID=A0ABQ1UAP4_9FLAO|nr:RagB/SusD family nutrient uptake outer membrane protein [Flavobacterium limi]GGF14284.1 membrane protein [Flavobacterium limi]